MIVKDMFKHEVKEGYIIAAHTQSGLHIGRVTNISEKGNITIDRTGTAYGKRVIPFWVNHRNVLIIEPHISIQDIQYRI